MVHRPPKLPALVFTRPLHGARSLAAERASWHMHRALAGCDFAEPAEIQRFISAQGSTPFKDLAEDADPADRAQDLFYRACETPSTMVARRLLDEAQEADPDNLDVAVERTRYPQRRPLQLEPGGPLPALEALAVRARAVLDGLEHEADEHGIWPYLPARPALRALAALALARLNAGDVVGALEVCEELLAYNPADNQGARYVQFALLLELGLFDRAREAADRHGEEESALFLWGRVLLELETDGDAETALANARAVNEEVESVLLRPEWAEPVCDSAAAGSPEEADTVSDILWRAWHRRPAAVAWLRSMASDDELAEKPDVPVLERILEADEGNLRDGLLAFIDAADEPTVNELWLWVREGPGDDDENLDRADGAVRLLDQLGRAGDDVEALVGYLGRHSQSEAWGECPALPALARLGEAAVDPLLDACCEKPEGEAHMAWAEALAECGVKRPEIFDVLAGCLEADPVLGASYFQDYGDAAALPLLLRCLDATSPDPIEGAPSAAADLLDAIESLGGKLSPEQEERFADAIEQAAHWRTPGGREELERMFLKAMEAGRAAERPPSAPPYLPGGTPLASAPDVSLVRPDRPGRNESCWCGSGKKYKKCHLREDEAGAD